MMCTMKSHKEISLSSSKCRFCSRSPWYYISQRTYHAQDDQQQEGKSWWQTAWFRANISLFCIFSLDIHPFLKIIASSAPNLSLQRPACRRSKHLQQGLVRTLWLAVSPVLCLLLSVDTVAGKIWRVWDAKLTLHIIWAGKSLRYWSSRYGSMIRVSDLASSGVNLSPLFFCFAW